MKNHVDELMAALGVVPGEVEPGFYTIKQIAKMTNSPERGVSRKVADNDRFECKMFRVNLGKNTRPVAHYRLKSCNKKHFVAKLPRKT